MYSLYLRNFRSALADISQWLISNHGFARFIQQASSNPACKGLSFQSYLLLPVQRIPRYKLLLEDLLKYTSATHVDHQNIGKALQTIEEVAEFVNENIHEHEMALSVIEIQRTLGMKESLLAPGRRLLKAGALFKICRKNHQRRQFYLFTDILLYSSSSSSPLGGDDQVSHRSITLEECKVMDVPDAPGCRNQFTIISHEKSFIVYADSAASKESWMQALVMAIAERRDARNTIQMDNSLRRRIARARQSTLTQFPRVAENFDAPVWEVDETANQCYICFREFSLFVRRHHCRACGKIVCNSCSRKNIVFVGSTSTESKEGRGCDQCIARMFGREALESPPSTFNRMLSRPRQSVSPNAIMQGLSVLNMGGSCADDNSSHHQSATWRRKLRRRGSSNDKSTTSNMLGNVQPVLPSIAHLVQQENNSRIGGRLRSDSAPAPYIPTSEKDSIELVNVRSTSPDSINGHGGGARLSMLLVQNAISKHVSTGSSSIGESEGSSPQASTRTTMTYDSSLPICSPPVRAAGSSSPMSTVSHNRVSMVSSSCSTIVSDSSLRPNKSRAHRRPTVYTVNEEGGDGVQHTPAAIGKGSRYSNKSANSYSSLLALFSDGNEAMGGGTAYSSNPASLPSLVSQIAPPQLSVVQAEAVASRQMKNKPSVAADATESTGNGGTLCSLCHGDLADNGCLQHQCSSCLSLVCSRCINHRPLKTGAADQQQAPSTASTPGVARILSMYIPEGYEHTAGEMLCSSCIGYSSEPDEDFLKNHNTSLNISI